MTIMSLWLPILVSTAVTFFAGAAIWMAMPWHKKDFAKTPDEEAVRAALQGSAAGHYSVPNVTDPAMFKDPDVQKKLIDGPQAFITVVPSGLPTMGNKLVINAIYNLAVAIVCAYMLSRTVGAGAEYLTVFRVTGTVAFIAYGMAYVQDSIWFGRQWSLTAKTFLDALIYSVLIGGVFGWLA